MNTTKGSRAVHLAERENMSGFKSGVISTCDGFTRNTATFVAGSDPIHEIYFLTDILA